jgi:ribosome-associated protein
LVKGNSGLASVKLAKLCRKIALDKKAEDAILLDMRAISSVADFFLICTGTSEPHLKAIANEIERRLRDEGIRARHREGFPPSRWIVMDYNDVLVHIFHPELRQRYALEQLCGDAKRVK